MGIGGEKLGMGMIERGLERGSENVVGHAFLE